MQVTDTGLCKLIQNAPLVELVLSAAKEITDKSIFMMASSVSSSLEKLYVSGCNLISPHVLRYLKVKSSKFCFIRVILRYFCCISSAIWFSKMEILYIKTTHFALFLFNIRKRRNKKVNQEICLLWLLVFGHILIATVHVML